METCTVYTGMDFTGVTAAPSNSNWGQSSMCSFFLYSEFFFQKPLQRGRIIASFQSLSIASSLQITKFMKGLCDVITTKLQDFSTILTRCFTKIQFTYCCHYLIY
uniref:Uncharacterized protein n=1 Tax=Octopus bimaculoides TaxID=37653 RepID=A0A0L8GEZ2_OCTBM